MTTKIDPKAELGERITTAYFNYEIPDFSEGYTAGLQDKLVQDLVSALKNGCSCDIQRRIGDINIDGSCESCEFRDDALSAYQAAIGGEK